MIRNTMGAGQKGLKALTAALKKKENKFVKKMICVHWCVFVCAFIVLVGLSTLCGPCC